MTSEFELPVELRVGDVSTEVARFAVTNPADMRPKLAKLLRDIAHEVEKAEDNPDERPAEHR